MANTTLVLNLSDSWVSVNTALGAAIGAPITVHNVGVNWVIARLGTQPAPSDRGVYITDMSKPSYQLISPTGGEELWVRGAEGAPCTLLVQTGVSLSFSESSFPRSVLEGLNAFTIQGYSEANRKNGTQFVASRKLTVTSGQVIDSIIKTGNKPIDLKSREFAYSGLGLDADIFEGATFTGGTQDPVYSSNGITPSSFDFQLLTGFTLLTTGTKFAATMYAFGEDSQQARGSPLTALGSNYILAPNTNYLLRITSNDNQNISARIEGYNGFLDLPFAN